MASTKLLLVLFLVQTCVAPAVNGDQTNIVPSALDSAISPRSAMFADLDPINSCTDFNHCRSLASIVTSCLGTIFACVWVAVHKNMPGPKQTWISVQIESLKVVVMTLLVPEWVLAWAVRQFLRAREIAEKLEKARLDAVKRGGGSNNGREDDDEREGSDERAGSDEIRPLSHQMASESVAEQPTFAIELCQCFLANQLSLSDRIY